MVVVVTGSRFWRDRALVRSVLAGLPPRSEVWHGAAPGLDSVAASVAASLGHRVFAVPAQWARFGPSAGPRRNAALLAAARPSLVLAFPLPGSRGTWSCVALARAAGVPVRVINHWETTEERGCQCTAA